MFRLFSFFQKKKNVITENEHNNNFWELIKFILKNAKFTAL